MRAPWTKLIFGATWTSITVYADRKNTFDDLKVITTLSRAPSHAQASKFRG